MDYESIKEIVALILEKENIHSLLSIHPKPFPTGVSNRHIHLSQHDLELLFGVGHCIECERDLSQPGQFAAAESVILAGPKGCLEKVRVLGPVRTQTQVEISKSDSFQLGIVPPVRESGKLDGSTGLTVIGPKGSIQLTEGVIIARRHLHMTPSDARQYDVVDGQTVQVKVEGERGIVFDQVVVRVSEKFVLEFHIDLDEANAAGIRQGESSYLVVSGNRLFQNADLSPRKSDLDNKLIEQPQVLVTEDIVRKAQAKKAVLVINEGVICTPLAKDTIKELGIEVIWK